MSVLPHPEPVHAPDGRLSARRSGCVAERVEAQARRSPAAVAVECRGERMTYAELNARADHVARLLRGRGVGPEVCVGIALDRSPEMVAAVLGVLRAGGAYVPLDVAYPRERLAHVVADAALPVVLTRSALLERLPASSARTVCLDADAVPLAAESDADLPMAVAPGNLAYVLYTSGSTGRPKGVLVEHCSVLALLDWAEREYPPEALSGVLASTSLAFDLSVFELFLPLTTGGRVILAADALELPRLPARDEVTLLNTVPSAAEALLRAGAIPAGVRVVNLAGEALRRSLADGLLALPGVERVYNLYGPTEDTTYSTFARVLPSGEGPPPIGRPLPGTGAYVLDEGLHLAPEGDTGELYLAGEGLARGYLGRPELTAERFLPDPLAASGGGRMYRTGDRVRRLAGGELEFLGRVDRQVKLRGHRIELGEVEAVLEEAPSVRAAVVLLREDPPGGPRLVAYTVGGEPGDAPVEDALRAHLRARLPEYMIPSAFVALDAFPLTPNGKVDRGALPGPPVDGPAGPGHVAPRTPTEEEIARIWGTVLGRERVGAHDSFFRLGGDSLRAARMLAAVWESCGVEIPLHRLFEAPTLAEVAAVVDRENEALLARVLGEMEGLSDEEARALLDAEEGPVVETSQGSVG